MTPFQDPTRQRIEESRTAMDEAYDRMTAQRHRSANEERLKPERWIEGTGPFVCAIVVIVAAAVCIAIWGWPWSA